MADNIYLLETRLSKAQQSALATVRDVARAKGLTVFLVGGAVRDLIAGSAVRDLDVVVQGNALKLKKDIEKAGGITTGEVEAGQAFFARFPGGVRMEIGSTLTISFPKPGKPVAKPGTLLEDLRRRDFTANAMALSLNEGSYGLLMDPLNGVADIENRELRLVSNYGFIEDPVRMVRAARLMARLGWGMDEKTQARYDTGKTEGYISAMGTFHRGYETEEIFHEEDPLRVMRRLEEEGWIQHLFPALTVARANAVELDRLREAQAQLQMQGIVTDATAVAFPLLTAKLSAAELADLKQSFPRQGFVEQIDTLEMRGKEFATQLGAKSAALPSQAYRLITSAEPETVLWVAYTTKSGALQAKFKNFYTEWPQARQKMPHVLMQEMRIVPELPQYDELLDKLFFELMDGNLSTTEEMKAFLEPYSPPAPPPPVSLRRPRAPKKDAKQAKSRKKAAATPVDADANQAADPEAPVSPIEPHTEDAPAPPAAAPEPVAKPAPKSEKPAKPQPPAKLPTKPKSEAAGQPVPEPSAKGKPASSKPKTGAVPAASAKKSAGKAAPAAPKKKTAAKAAPSKTASKAAPKTPAKKPAAPAKKAAKKPAPPAKSSKKSPAKAPAGKPATRATKAATSKKSAKKR